MIEEEKYYEILKEKTKRVWPLTKKNRNWTCSVTLCVTEKIEEIFSTSHVLLILDDQDDPVHKKHIILSQHHEWFYENSLTLYFSTKNFFKP